MARNQEIARHLKCFIRSTSPTTSNAGLLHRSLKVNWCHEAKAGGNTKSSFDFQSQQRSSSFGNKSASNFIDAFWENASQCKSKHFIYSGAQKQPKKQSELSKSIDKIDDAIQKQQRDHLMHTLSDFSKLKSKFFKTDKHIKEDRLLDRRSSQEVSRYNYKPMLHSIHQAKLSPSPARTVKLIEGVLATQKAASRDASIKSSSSKKTNIDSNKQLKPSVSFGRSINASTIKSDHNKSVNKLPGKVAASSKEQKGKYELPNSFIYVSKTFKPAAQVKDIDPSDITQKRPAINDNKDSESIESESIDLSTEDLNYRFSRFTISPADPSSSGLEKETSSRDQFDSEEFLEANNPKHTMKISDGKTQLIFQKQVAPKSVIASRLAKSRVYTEPHHITNGDMSYKPSHFVKTDQKIHTKPHPSSKFSILSDKQSEILKKMRSKKRLKPEDKEEQGEESESVRVINLEIDRMINLLKEKHHKAS